LDAKSKDFQQLMLARNQVAESILENGFNALLVDVDQIWLKSPLEDFDADQDCIVRI
jgi:hypothetical protein